MALSHGSYRAIALLLVHTAPFWVWKCAHPNELDLAEVQIQVNHVAKETYDFDQGTRKYGHILFGLSIGLPPRNSYLVAN